jgi:uncharacterized protein YheU (UPF0270 family)
MEQWVWTLETYLEKKREQASRQLNATEVVFILNATEVVFILCRADYNWECEAI